MSSARSRDQAEYLQKSGTAAYRVVSVLDALTKNNFQGSGNVFGSKQNEYFSLLGKCFSKVSNEKDFKTGSFEYNPKTFLFTICPFINVTQSGVEPASNGNTNVVTLGVWSAWKNDKDRSSSNGPLSFSRLLPTQLQVQQTFVGKMMTYTNGDECWNGPKRFVKVHVVCGPSDQLIDVNENGKCSYDMTLQTPMACSNKHTNAVTDYFLSTTKTATTTAHEHDEL